MICETKKDCKWQCCDQSLRCPLLKKHCYYYPGVDYETPAWVPIVACLVTVILGLLLFFAIERYQAKRRPEQTQERQRLSRAQSVLPYE